MTPAPSAPPVQPPLLTGGPFWLHFPLQAPHDHSRPPLSGALLYAACKPLDLTCPSHPYQMTLSWDVSIFNPPDTQSSSLLKLEELVPRSPSPSHSHPSPPLLPSSRVCFSPVSSQGGPQTDRALSPGDLVLEEKRSGRNPLRKKPDTEKEVLAAPSNWRGFCLLFLFCLLPACKRSHSPDPHSSAIIPLACNHAWFQFEKCLMVHVLE